MPEMIYRRFGRTELQMPVFSCGGMRYQHGWQNTPMSDIPADSHRNLEETIERAVSEGINHIETARGYGSSETQLGHVLPKFDRDRLIVQTKVGPKEDSDKFVEEFEDSLARLQLDYVDLLGIHGINNRQTYEWACRPGGCLERAKEFVRAGKVRFIGFSTHGSLDVIIDAINCDIEGGFDYINLHWYFIFQRNWSAIEAATTRDMGVFIISPTDKGGRLYSPPDRFVDLCKPLHPIVFNDLFCLNYPLGGRPLVHTLSVGAARPSDFALHLEALHYMDRAEETLRPILERMDAAMEEHIEPELRDLWSIDLPEWDETPGGINIPLALWLRNLKLAYGLEEFAKWRYSIIGNGGHWMPGYQVSRLDEEENIDLSPIAKRSGLGDRLEPLLREAHEMLKQEEQGKRLSEGG